MFKYYNLSKFFSYNRATVLAAVFISFITAATIWSVTKNYPGIQGVGFSKMIHPSEVAELESEMKKDGFETYLRRSR